MVYGESNSININIFNNQILMAIVGSFDCNLKELEKISGSEIYFRGNSIVIKGEKNANEKVKNAIEYLIERFRSERKMARDLMQEGEFIEIFISTPLEECERRDPKGLYKKVREGQLKNFTGIDSAYEKPDSAEIILNTQQSSPEELVEVILKYLKEKNKI